MTTYTLTSEGWERDGLVVDADTVARLDREDGLVGGPDDADTIAVSRVAALDTRDLVRMSRRLSGRLVRLDWESQAAEREGATGLLCEVWRELYIRDRDKYPEGAGL